MRRAILLGLLALGLSAQQPEPAALIAWNEFAIAGNAWRTQHRPYIWSKADHQRLEQARAAWKKFDRLAREAQF